MYTTNVVEPKPRPRYTMAELLAKIATLFL